MLSLNADATIKFASRFDMDSMLPPGDRLCRSMALISKDANQFTLACGAGASSTGDVWALSFSRGKEGGTSNNSGGTGEDGGVLLDDVVFSLQYAQSDAGVWNMQTYCKSGQTLDTNWNHRTQLNWTSYSQRMPRKVLGRIVYVYDRGS